MYMLLGSFRWMAVAGVILGLAGGYFFWEEKRRIGILDVQGVETTATIIQIRRQKSQNSRESYWADVKWRDADGIERKRERIPVSGTFARRVLKDGLLIQRVTRIKYLADAPDARPLMLEDGAHNNWLMPGMMWLSFGFAAFCAFGWHHMLRFEQRAAKRQSQPAA